jgi:hypothetical protein
MRKRRELYRRTVQRLEREGLLDEGLTPQEAVDLLFALLGSRVYQDLVEGRGWSRRRYELRMGNVVRRAVCR